MFYRGRVKTPAGRDMEAASVPTPTARLLGRSPLARLPDRALQVRASRRSPR